MKRCDGYSKKQAQAVAQRAMVHCPPSANADFIAHMEDVLAVYVRPYDPRFPQVCMDEISKQLLGDTREPLPMEPGYPERQDYEYERHGVCNVLLACEPLAGKRSTQVTTQRTKVDWAHFIQHIVDVHSPQAEKIVLVLDTLNTHTPAALYEVFPPAEARRLVEKLEIHSTRHPWELARVLAEIERESC
jgi:DDE superfamily endonuclease